MKQGKVRNPKRTPDGKEILTEKVYIPMHRVLLNYDRLCVGQRVAQKLQAKNKNKFARITFMDGQGDPLSEASEAMPVGFRFKIEGPGIDPERVLRVIFPALDYGEPEVAIVEVEMVVFEDEDE